MNIVIDFATINDLKDIQNLNLLLFKKEQKEYDKKLNVNWPFDEEGINYFTDCIKNENGCIIISKIDDKIIGYLAGRIKINRNKSRNLKNQAEIGNMLVLEKYRNKKIGTKMVKEFFKWAKNKGIINIRVTASSKNKKALDFYRKNGFKDYNYTLEIDF